MWALNLHAEDLWHKNKKKHPHAGLLNLLEWRQVLVSAAEPVTIIAKSRCQLDLLLAFSSSNKKYIFLLQLAIHHDANSFSKLTM